MRHGRGWSIAILTGIVALMATRAAAVPLLRVDGGTGVPGGTVAAVVALADDTANEAVAASFGIAFPEPPLGVPAGTCALADRLASTHQITTTSGPGLLDLIIQPLAGTPPLGDGDLASCDFTIDLGTPAGTAALELVDVVVTDADGEPVAVARQDGEIIIEAPLATPTVTNTPTVTTTPTITQTATPVPPTATPTVTPTATIFRPTVLADNFGGCAVTPAGGVSGWPLLLGAAFLLRLRRRR